jgi:hypothetical protein
MLCQLLSAAEVLCTQMLPRPSVDKFGVKFTAVEAVPLPEAFTARSLIGYVVQLDKPLHMMIGLAVISGEGVTHVVPLSVEYS